MDLERDLAVTQVSVHRTDANLGHPVVSNSLLLGPVCPSRRKLEHAEVPEDLKLLAYLGPDVFVERMGSLQLGLEVIDVSERKARPTQTSNYAKNINRAPSDRRGHFSELPYALKLVAHLLYSERQSP